MWVLYSCNADISLFPLSPQVSDIKTTVVLTHGWVSVNAIHLYQSNRGGKYGDTEDLG